MRAFTDRSDATLKLRRPTPNLTREIVLVLAGKFLALFLIWLTWFARPQAPELDAERVRAALTSSHPVAQQGTRPDAKP